MAYQVVSSRIQTWSLEAHVVDHCNLRCAECCTLSPSLPERVTDPDALHRDLARAARVLRPAVFKLTGGEPFLHPDLAACVAAARSAGIAEIISVTTNGFLAARAPDAVWAGIDRLTVSLYPSAPLAPASLAVIRARAAEHGVSLTLKPAPTFQKLTPDAPLDDAGARAVHAACWLKVRCHVVHDGRFFTCTRAPHLVADGGVVLDDEDDLLERVLDHLEADAPMPACHVCLGASGERFPHRQLV